MKRRRSDRGAMLLLAAFAVVAVASILLQISAAQETRRARAEADRLSRDAALQEALGGLRWASTGIPLPIRRQDEDGVLTVEVEEGRVVSTYAFAGVDAPRVRVSASRRGSDLVDRIEE